MLLFSVVKREQDFCWVNYYSSWVINIFTLIMSKILLNLESKILLNLGE